MQREFTAQEILDALRIHYQESIFVTDGEGKVIFVNELGAKRLKSTVPELWGKNVQDLVKSGMYERSTVMEAIQKRKEVIATLWSPGVSDSSASQSVPVFDAAGDVVMVVTNNMSEAKSAEWEKYMSAEREKNLHLMRELDYLRVQNQSDVIANSPAMKAVIANINAVASTDTTVVIYGESGTGKDIMARLIHDRSQRAENSFISINCAAIPDSLLESELFGYEKGSFTGALSKGKIGLFEAAKGGTVFLDEIGEMPMALQSKLLRALENREIRRVGGVANIPIDIRIICATNENLREMMREGKFREDLFYRLNVFPITLPRLRDRPDDIIPLAESFLRGLNEKYNTRKVFADVTLKTMLEHPWPGNIRELRNVVERIYVISPGNELIFTPVPTANYSPETMATYVCETPNTPLPHYDSLKQFSDEFEKRYINQVLGECGGHIQKAADKLGIHRSVLWRKLHKKDG